MARKTGNRSGRASEATLPVTVVETTDAGDGLRPWHLLALGTLGAMAVGLVVVRATSIVNMVSVSVAVGTAGLVAAGLFRSVLPLVWADAGEYTDMLGGRTRAALEREKMLVLRSIKEVEFDRAMRKISEADFQDIANRLRSRAAGLIRQLDGDDTYLQLIEHDLATRIGKMPAPASTGVDRPVAAGAPAVTGVCDRCQTSNDRDARFCKSCGTRLPGAA